MSKIYDLILENIYRPENDSCHFESIDDNLSHEDYLHRLKSNIITQLALGINDRTLLYNLLKLYGKPVDNYTIKLNTNMDPTVTLTNTIVTIGGKFYFVTLHKHDLISNTTCISLYPEHNLKENICITCLQYIGNYLHQLSCLFHIEKNYDVYRNVLTPFINSEAQINGDYINNSITVTHKCNKTQSLAISNLKYNLELIHGPPGTGKSTTIINIIEHALPPTHNILCTAIQNQAIEALVIKLEATNTDFVVIGNETRLKETSQKHTLEKYFAKSKEIEKLNEQINLHLKDIDNLTKYTLDDTSSSRKKILELRSKYNVDPERTSLFYDVIGSKIKEKEKLIEREKDKITFRFRIFVCTIDTSYKFYLQLKSQKTIETIILDEAGSVKETEMLPILRLNPRNIIMIGDPKQLSAFCDLHISEEKRRCLTISPLERLIDCGKCHSMLSVQYRMTNAMCNIVSNLFYNQLLISDESKNVDSSDSVVWIDSKGDEELDVKLESYYNRDESQLILKLCEKHMGEEIMIITSYNAQLKLIQNLLGDNNPNILVRTIDASQGSESDIIILSLVRSNDKNKIGFLYDQKRMCVALSRAKKMLYIVGNIEMFRNSRHKIWKTLINMIEQNNIVEYQNDSYDSSESS